jgi:hypothetical protein
MYVEKFRTRQDIKVIAIKDYVYGFSTTWVIEYEDGSFERIKYMDKQTEDEAEAFKKLLTTREIPALG